MRIILAFLTTMLLVTLCGIAPAEAAKKKKSDENTRYASIVMDADTGVILSSRHADKKLHPASLTKMMTLLMAFEALDRGDITLNTSMIISSRAAAQVPSKLDLPAGYRIKVRDAIYALVTKSANDVAVALAEHLGGSESRFAAAMTARAQSIGMSSTQFRNASGLHNPSQITTARDMAKLARYIIQRYPHYYSYFSTASFTYRGKTYRNHNRLMESYKGMDGFKTGYIAASGFNLVASARRDGRRLIGVVFGGRSGPTRNAHMAGLLDAGFGKAAKTRIASVKTPPVPGRKPQIFGLASMDPSLQQVQTPSRQPTLPTSSFTSLASLNTQTRIAVKPDEVKPDYVAISQKMQSGAFGEMMGQGDFDPGVTKRIETGLIAIAMHKGEYRVKIPNPDIEAVKQADRKPTLEDASAFMQDSIEIAAVPAALPHPKDTVGKWAIQIGAYQSAEASAEALDKAQKRLPSAMSDKAKLTIPLQTSDGVIYRARLSGFSEQDAHTACKFFKDCISVAPAAARISQTQ